MNLALSEGVYRDFRAYSDRLDPISVEVAAPLLALTPEEVNRHVGYLAGGSHNQNTRSLAQDGEVAFVAAQWQAINGLMDFIVIAGLSTWIEDLETLEELFPGYDGLARRISRWIRMMV